MKTLGGCYPLRIFATAVSVFLLVALSVSGQQARDRCVELSAAVEVDPPRVTLSWRPSSHSVLAQRVYRRLKGGPIWGAPIAAPANSATSFVDDALAPGVAYEYFVYQQLSGATGSATGYIHAGVQVPVVPDRGRVILVVDDTLPSVLASEIARFEADLAGDGWEVLREVVPRTLTPPQVRAVIQARYAEDPIRTRSVILLGRIPVPYSGNIAPDGHAEHVGAWPADVYYGDVDGVWTDSVINTPTGNVNVPGDGRFDQSVLVGNLDVELEVGRIDMANMTIFSGSEVDLLRRYLDRNHAFRHGLGEFADIPRRGLVDDHFGYFNGEAFAATAWGNFPTLVGAPEPLDWFTTLNTQRYLWAFGCGPGSYQGAGGIGSSNDFATIPSKAVFTGLFGSYFGDWNNGNNFLRAPLAGPDSLALVSFWSGRPYWYVHPMGLGETIGYCAKLTQNNAGQFSSAYAPGFSARWVHIALMGDPTLRMHYPAPASAPMATEQDHGVALAWTASSDPAVTGYIIGKAPTTAGPFLPVVAAPVAGTTYTDRTGVPGVSHVYRVQSLKLEQTPSGTFWNTGTGVFVTGASDVLANAPEIDVTGEGRFISGGDTESSAQNGTNFGAVSLLSSGERQTFLVRNLGTAPLVFPVDPVQITGLHAAEFTVTLPLAGSLAPGASAELEIEFVPAGLGSRVAQVLIASNDADEAAYSFVLGGQGVPTPPVMTVVPGSIERTLSVSQMTSVPVQIQNSGLGVLNYTLRSSLDRYAVTRSDELAAPIYRWIDIAETGAELGFSNPDDATTNPVSLGFNFPYYGQNYSSVRICTNGFLSFTDSSSTAGSVPLPTPSAPATIVAGYWSDLLLVEGSKVFTQLVDGNFIVQFDEMGFFGDATGRRVTFEIILRPNGEILFQYEHLSAPGGVVTVGFQDGSRLDGLTIEDSDAEIVGGLAIQINPPTALDWLQLSSAGGTVAAGQTAELTLELDSEGLAPGVYAALIEVEGNDPELRMQTLSVKLTVQSNQPVSVFGNGLVIESGSNDPRLIDHTAFGVATVLGVPVIRTYTITNGGSVPLNISTSVTGAGFAMETPPPGSIAPGAEATFQVRFSPPSSGAFTGQVQIISNEPEPYVFALSGSGFTASEQWRLARFGSALNAGAGADGNDADGDGYDNFEEYAFGLNPVVPGVSAVSEFGTSLDGYLQIVFQRNVEALDVTYIVEATETFTSWETLATSSGGGAVSAASARAVEESGSGGVRNVRVEDHVLVSGTETRVIRVRTVRME